MTFGEIIKRNREARKLSQESLAKIIREKYHVRMSAAYISMIESNVRTNLTVNLLNSLLDYFDLSIEDTKSLFKSSLYDVSYNYKNKKELVAEQELAYEIEGSCNNLESSYLQKQSTLSAESKRALKDFYDFLLLKEQKNKSK
ncbi:helix-turn-helix domain-containing protein [Selenomonadales bacterium OttesenSCG-928-I06]|nr:helix-turn-helix domain-containing protein [Selenomonadales bacterium OttesenSCG-928-I06]